MSEEKQYFEINFLLIYKTLWKNKFSIIIISLLCAIAVYGYSVFFIPPMYKVTTDIYVLDNTGDSLTTQDLQLANYLVKDFEKIILSKSVLKKVIEEQVLDVDISTLSHSINVITTSDTRVVSIQVRDSNPIKATNIANSLRDIAIEKILEVTKISDVSILDSADIPEAPDDSNIKKNTFFGLVVGFAISSLVYLFIELFNDKIRDPSDIEEKLGIVLLGVVPERKTRK